MAAGPGKRSALNPKLGMTYKRSMKIERIARLSCDPAGFSNAQIANMLGCHVQTIVLIRQLPEYHAKMIEVATGVISQQDQQLYENVDTMRDEIRSMVPSAMMVIRNAVHGKYGTNLQYKASTEILDREGTLAKVSKSSVSVEVKPNLTLEPSIRNNLMALLTSAPTVSDSGQSEAAFTASAANALSQQVKMSEDNTVQSLEALDLSGTKPN